MLHADDWFLIASWVRSAAPSVLCPLLSAGEAADLGSAITVGGMRGQHGQPRAQCETGPAYTGRCPPHGADKPDLHHLLHRRFVVEQGIVRFNAPAHIRGLDQVVLVDRHRPPQPIFRPYCHVLLGHLPAAPEGLDADDAGHVLGPLGSRPHSNRRQR